MTRGQWATDPTGRHQYRWYDGARWTDRVSDAGVESIDPLHAAAPASMAPQRRGGVLVPAGTQISSRGRRFLGWLLTVVLMIVTLLIGYAIWTMILWSRGQTPAKQLMGMRVIMAETGRTARWGEMLLRGLVIDTLIPIFIPFVGWLFGPVSAFWIFGNDENRRLTDYMASTIVVDDPRNLYG